MIQMILTDQWTHEHLEHQSHWILYKLANQVFKTRTQALCFRPNLRCEVFPQTNSNVNQMKNLFWISVSCFVHVQISDKKGFALRAKTKTTIEQQLECAQRHNNHKLQPNSILPTSWVSQNYNWINDTLHDMHALLRIITMLILTLIVLKKERNEHAKCFDLTRK